MEIDVAEVMKNKTIDKGIALLVGLGYDSHEEISKVMANFSEFYRKTHQDPMTGRLKDSHLEHYCDGNAFYNHCVGLSEDSKNSR